MPTKYESWTQPELTSEIRINQDVMDTYDERLRRASRKSERIHCEEMIKAMRKANNRIRRELKRRGSG